ncbi:MAG: hypothetical protein KAT90_10355 [Gammaproteobacteria bacterium]|nr:hypothetical protein [Gammaproteobacteria bacterium]
MIDKRALSEDLTKVFINYQERLDNPMPETPSGDITATEAQARLMPYYHDPVFRRKVDSLVSGVMNVIDKHT